MRKVTYGAAVSLDGYIAGPDEALDWLLWSDDARAISAESWKGVDTILMGRKTYEVGLKLAKGKNPYAHIKTYVFSRTLPEDGAPGAEIVSSDAVGFVRELKASEGGDICMMGGGELAKTFFEAGLIDEIGFNIHPVLLGRGVPLYHDMDVQVNLELVECRRFENGCVYVYYRVVK